MMDKYDRAVKHLLTFNGSFGIAVETAWRVSNDEHPGACLFKFAGDRHIQKVGCLTMIRNGGYFVAETIELTVAIRADKRLPKDKKSITRESLPVFAEWQRRLDRELPSRRPQTEVRG